MNAILSKVEAPTTKDVKPNIDDELRDAVREAMTTKESAQKVLARIQEILDKKAAQMRAPFVEKVRRIKESA